MTLKPKAALLLSLIAGALAVSPAYAQAPARETSDTGSASDRVQNLPSETRQMVKSTAESTADRGKDVTLTTKVKAALLSDGITQKYSINVEADEGTVTLGGVVDSSAAAARAESVAHTVAGVRMVSNELTWPVSNN